MENSWIMLAGALGFMLWWLGRSQKKRQHRQLSAVYHDVLTSDKYQVKGKFDE